jgi:diacylglycerol kinase family enzyme
VPATAADATGPYNARVRLLLIVNVKAQSVTPWTVEVIERALSSEFKVDLVRTKRQEHAMHLARGAAHEGIDLVVSFGGDGTVNEVANGLAGTETPMAVIPGGGTNVLARSLGIPRDPVQATWYLIANRRNPPHRVPLGRADGRYFTFACGVGLDGAIVRDVERRQLLKKTGRQGFYLWSGLRIFFGGIDRKRAPIHLRWGANLEHRRDGLFLAICQKTRPLTYLGNREIDVSPGARLEKGLDCMALDTLRTTTVLRVLGQIFGSKRHIRNPHVLYLHDQTQIEVRCDFPMPVQMDGEFIGDRTQLLLESVPDALSLLY